MNTRGDADRDSGILGGDARFGQALGRLADGFLDDGRLARLASEALESLAEESGLPERSARSLPIFSAPRPTAFAVPGEAGAVAEAPFDAAAFSPSGAIESFPSPASQALSDRRRPETAREPSAFPQAGSPRSDAAPPLAGAALLLSGPQPLGPFDFLEGIRRLESAEAPSSRLKADSAPPPAGGIDAASLRRDFPVLSERVNGRPLVWLDNAATTQKPRAVIERLRYFYEHENSNVHRGAHALAARATDAFEASREKVRQFLGAASAREIIFVRGATEGINLVAQSWGRKNVGKDDEIIVTWLEHHANIVPWQLLCEETGARLRVAPVDERGQVLVREYEKLFTPRTKLVAFAQVSNVLGTVTPVQDMVAIARRNGATVLVDGAQAVSHLPVDVRALDCDFYVFSGHKVFAPTGIGVLYGKIDLLERMPPWQGGGNMIADVKFEGTSYQSAPLRFEAGTASIADAVGLGAAIDYLNGIGMPNISRYEHGLLSYATSALERIPGLRIIGTAAEKASVLSFVLDGHSPEKVGRALNDEGIAVRAGHHCAQPILRRFGLEATVRPSLALYNTREDIDRLVSALWNLVYGRSPGIE